MQRTFSGNLEIPGEPAGPSVSSTSFPGPTHKTFVENLGQRTCNLAVKFPVNLDKSKGNYIADTDGNVYLDVFMNISSTAMGYNHPDVLSVARSEEMVKFLANRTASGSFPLEQMNELIDSAFFGGIAPSGFTRVANTMCGSCAVEIAFKHAFISYAQRKRGGMSVPPSEEELSSCMLNKMPGSPNFAILSLKKSFHGRLFGTLSATRTKPMYKVDLPSFSWPAAEPPAYKFPLDE